MAAAGPIGSVIGAGIGAGFNYAGGKAQADAMKQASQLQNDYNTKALADAEAQRTWQRQQYQDYLARTQPYREMGNSAGASLTAMLARGPNFQTAQQLALPASSVGTLAAK